MAWSIRLENYYYAFALTDFFVFLSCAEIFDINLTSLWVILIILNYDGSESEKSHKKTVVYNATYLFALIQNVEWITFNFDHQEYKITKDALIEWYGEDFSTLQSEKELKTLIQNNWDDEYRVNQLF